MKHETQNKANYSLVVGVYIMYFILLDSSTISIIYYQHLTFSTKL